MCAWGGWVPSSRGGKRQLGCQTYVEHEDTGGVVSENGPLVDWTRNGKRFEISSAMRSCFGANQGIAGGISRTLASLVPVYGTHGTTNVFFDSPRGDKEVILACVCVCYNAFSQCAETSEVTF